MKQQEVKQTGREILNPLVNLLVKLGVRPATVTSCGIIITAAAAWYIWGGFYTAGSLVLLVGSILDAVDGGIARKTGVVSKAGAVLDSSADRLGEALVFLALIAGTAGRNYKVILYLAPVALVGSYMVSYVKARSEGAGISCNIGLLTRTERLVIIITGLFFSGIFYEGIILYTLGLITVGTWFTVLQRLIHVYRKDQK